MQGDVALDRVQRWMLEVITRPGTVRDALESQPARRELAPARLREVVLPSATLSAERRIGIYHDMYLARMIEALEFDYPGLASVLGHARFHALVEGYVAAHPSRSYTLNRLGDHLPEYVAGSTDLPRSALLADLARLELAITLVFDAERDEPLDAEAIATVPAEAWPGARFRTVAALRLLRLDYPVDDLLQSIKRGEPRPALRKSPRHLLVFRSDLAVKQLALSKREWTLLAALRDGLALEQAVGALSGMRPSVSETELFGWFRDWTRMGLFSGVVTGGG